MTYTLQQNAMGHLHIWRVSDGDNTLPQQISKYNYVLHGRESDIYIQRDTDIDVTLDALYMQDDRESLESGWPVVNVDIEIE